MIARPPDRTSPDTLFPFSTVFRSGITLGLIAAGLLALWQAWKRFGPALKPGRAIPVSKAALIANSADLIRQARRELDGADAYVKSQRTAIARRLQDRKSTRLNSSH